MNDDKNIKGLFNVSGCLTTGTMLKFLDEQLSQDESSIVQNHLGSCELCTDALEGFSTVTDRASILKTLETINRKITEKVSQSSTQKQLAEKKTRNLWVYGSVAASIGLLIGLYFIFNQINTQTSSEMAMIADTTIKHKTTSLENDIPETEKTDQETVEKSSIIQYETTDRAGITIGGIPMAEPQMKVEEVAKTAPMEYDATEEIADAEMPEIIGTDTNVTLHYETIDMEPAGNIPALTGGASINKSRKYTAIDNNMKSLTASYMIQSDNIDDSTVFTIVEESPEFTGGKKALSKFYRKNLVYPEQALANRIEGTVYLQFTVEIDGTLSDIIVLQPIGYGCEEEAIRLIKLMPPWEPAKDNGVPVRKSMNLPVKFELPK